jgi:hypothetical protein
VALVPLPEKESMDPADLPAIETGLAAFGHMLHTWQAVANVPGLFSKYFPFLRTLTGPGPLDQRIKEITAVQVAGQRGAISSQTIGRRLDDHH